MPPLPSRRKKETKVTSSGILQPVRSQRVGLELGIFGGLALTMGLKANEKDPLANGQVDLCLLL